MENNYPIMPIYIISVDVKPNGTEIVARINSRVVPGTFPLQFIGGQVKKFVFKIIGGQLKLTDDIVAAIQPAQPERIIFPDDGSSVDPNGKLNINLN